MLCPRHDSQLVDRAPAPLSGLELHYLYCPNCHGHWLSAFDANYISSMIVPSTTELDPVLEHDVNQNNLSCPQCRKILIRALEESIPPSVLVYRCPDNHGYFFPAGALAIFKKAQETNIAYHKQWHVPLTSVASALLLTLFGLLVSGGLVTGVLEGQRQESINVHATETISSQHAYVDQKNSSVTIIALTSQPVVLTLVMDGTKYLMIAPDNKSHVIRIPLSAGLHHYFFRFTKNNTVYDTQPYPFSL